ncbi:exonuclease, putative [Plasmodium gaboni]|uniref:Exonuclease, putative n=1 Tax=Plasmodium gaboni TaxID=647221 RepID=A0ABY1ULM8_9APIC|nr:exonuclease, putative [Plasmodium gaboni]
MNLLNYTHNYICIIKYKHFYQNLLNIQFFKHFKCIEKIGLLKRFYSTKFISKEYEKYDKYNNDKKCIILKNAHSVSKDIKIIENEKECDEAAEEINKSEIIAVDFEGTNLGRYGKVCLMQVYIEKKNIYEQSDNIVQKYYIFDLLKTSVIKSAQKIIENKKTLKLIHDCREDSSALYNQLGIKLENVYDTSRAHILLMEKQKKNDIYQVSFSQLINDYLGINDDSLSVIKKEMYKNEKIWETRPLSNISIIYALKNVKYLYKLYNIFDKLLPKKLVLEKSKDFVNYCYLNYEYKLPSDLAKRGNIVEAMLVSKSLLNCVFKLNSTRKGMACTPSTITHFVDVKIGDVVLCVVSNKSINQKILYLCKHDDVYDYWNLKERPRDKFKPSIHEHATDPMITFCNEEHSS